MDRWQNMQVFARVARLGSFSKAARELRISTTAASRKVNELETHLGTRLLHRTTRKVSLTEQGQQYLHRCEQLLQSVTQLESDLRSSRKVLRGRVALTTGTSFMQAQLAPVLLDFCQQYPEIELRIHLSDTRVDLLEHGLDLAVRIGHLADSNLIARKLTVCRHVLCASPSYLEQHGTPEHPNDLPTHTCIIDTNNTRFWGFYDGQEHHSFLPHGQLRINHAHLVKDALLRGMGIGLSPSFMIGPELERGELIPLLKNYQSHEPAIYTVYPPHLHMPATLQALLDCLHQHFTPEPLWDRWRHSLSD